MPPPLKVIDNIRTALSPEVLAATTALLLYLPDHLTAGTRIVLPPSLLRAALIPLAGLSILRLASGILSRAALNNWRLGPQPGWDDFTSEVAVVTGGSGGIGARIVALLAERGVSVAILDVVAPAPEALLSDKVTFFKVDLTQHDDVVRVGNEVKAHYATAPSILINNAGMGRACAILDATQDDLNRIARVNLLSHWSTVQQFLPAMISANKGHVVTVASMTSFLSLAEIADYASTKAGLMAFHEALTQELKHMYEAPNVITTIVHPFWVSTPMVAANKEGIEKSHGKMLSPDEVAGPIVEQVFARRGATLVLPKYTGVLEAVRAWPSWLGVGVRDLANRSLSKNSRKTREAAKKK